jgi:thiol-disulfide isomerase/thioredoxin
MIERLLILFAVVALVVSVVVVARAWTMTRQRRLMAQSPTQVWNDLGTTPDGRATLLSFSTPSCAACHSAQAPAIVRVEQALGDDHLRVICVDAAREPRVAAAFGVMTVPSTVILAPEGEVVAVNQGFAPTARLIEQLQHA